MVDYIERKWHIKYEEKRIQRHLNDLGYYIRGGIYQFIESEKLRLKVETNKDIFIQKLTAMRSNGTTIIYLGETIMKVTDHKLGVLVVMNDTEILRYEVGKELTMKMFRNALDAIKQEKVCSGK